tara:strand:+ start:638 stop:1231 length:594 start_codon:yes stop_codon:yes gene_type:complete
MYKIIRDEFSKLENTIHKISTNTFIAAFSGSEGWEQFVDDIYTNGLGIVEGADYVGVTTYTDARAAEYPPIKDQLDKIYHSGIDAWKADIKAVKDKYPKTQVGITSIAPIPDWVNTALFDKQKVEYIRAKERLERYELSAGVKNEDGTYKIEPLPISVIIDADTMRNPLIVRDEEEREAAQKTITQTPQAVIDSINT